MKSQILPAAEFEIMNYIWDTKAPVTSNMLMENVGNIKGWKLQTALTLFTRLIERGFLRAEKGTRRERVFYFVISRAEYLKIETENFASRYHKKSLVGLLTALSSEDLTKKELDELATWVEQAKERWE